MNPRKRLAVMLFGLATLALCAPVVPTSANWPVRTTASYISTRYSYRHPAVDVAARYGTTVQAVYRGVTVFKGWRNNCGGRQVYVYHGNGWYTAYYHLSSYSTYRGERLSTGEALGRVGTSGCATGPHVHVERWHGYPWHRGSYRVNPTTWLLRSLGGVYNRYEPRRYR